MTQDSQTSEQNIDELNQILKQILYKCFIDEAINVTDFEGWIGHEESGFLFAPEFLYAEQNADGNIQTGTVIHIYHPTLFPEPIFEYQYYTGSDTETSLETAFKLWIKSDAKLLFASLNPKENDVLSMDMDVIIDGKPIKRQAIFGNVLHYGNKQTVSEGNNQLDADSEHDFCPCCLFTQSMEAFKPLIESDKNYAIRLFALNNGLQNEVDADCRVNGEEWDQAKPLLKDYAQTWQSEDIEFRKQYMVIRTIDVVDLQSPPDSNHTLN